MHQRSVGVQAQKLSPRLELSASPSPTAVLPPPLPLQCPPPAKVTQPNPPSPPVYLNHQQHMHQRFVGVQAQKLPPRVELSASPSPTAVFPPPLPLQCPPPPKVTQPSTHSSNHQQHLKLPRVELSPSPSTAHFTAQERQSLSSTPSVSPLSTPNESPSMLNIISPPQNGAAALYPSTCDIVFPTRTSPSRTAVHTNQFSFGQGVNCTKIKHTKF